MYMNMPNIREIDSQIIAEIRKEGRELLYDQCHMNYKNTRLKKQVWKEISATIGLQPMDCMKRWKILRARYVRSTKQFESGNATPNTNNLELMNKLQFLKNFISNGNEIINVMSDLPWPEESMPLPPISSNSTTRVMKLENGSEVIMQSNIIPEESKPLPPISANTTSRVMKLENGSEVIIQSSKNRRILPKPAPTMKIVPTIKVLPESELKKIIPSNFKKEIPLPIQQTLAKQTVTETTESFNGNAGPYDLFGKHVAAELRNLPQRDAILLEQDIQNCITRAKLSCLDSLQKSRYSRPREILHVNVNSPSTYPSAEDSNDYDILSEPHMTIYEANY